MDLDEALKTTAVVVPELDHGCLTVTGTERRSWLQGLVTCDVNELGLGRGCRGLVLTKQGKILTDVNLLESEGTVYMSTAPETTDRMVEFFEGFLIMEDAELENRSDLLVWLTLHGPRAAQIAAEVAPGLAVASGCINWTDRGGAALVVPRERASEVVERVLAQWPSAAAVSDGAEWEPLRIQMGLPRFGVDYDSTHNPHDASLERKAISWTKGCYLGQEAVCMQDMRGKLKQRLVRLALDPGDPPPVGAPVYAQPNAQTPPAQTSVGQITSAARIPSLAQILALARVKAAFSEPCSTLWVGGRPARIVTDSPA
ncbi:MAG TPA: glycine cleavage T C-terminal barrel domain-containing protein [Polyangiaceae bacterium]